MLKLYIFFSSFFALLVIFSYYTILSIFSFLALLFILCSLLFFLKIEFISFLILFIYMGGILIFFLFSSLMLNMQFNSKKFKINTFSQSLAILIYLILLVKFWFLLFYLLVGFLRYYEFIFSFIYLPLTLNSHFGLFRTLKDGLITYSYDLSVNSFKFLTNSKFEDHFESLGLLSLYDQKWFLLFLIGFLLFSILVIVSSLCLKKCIIKN